MSHIYVQNTMPKQRDFSKKEHLGTVDWRIAKDWKILNWGSIFTIPPEELRKYNWGEIGFGLTIEFPIIKSGWDAEIKGQNSNVYYTVELDWEYLLERQASLFASLGWAKAEIEHFLKEQVEWLDKRSSELEKALKEQSVLEAAQNMSKLTGKSVNYWIAKIKETEEKKEEKNKETGLVLLGTVVKLGNEFFIEVTYKGLEIDEELDKLKGKWKIGFTEKYQTKVGALSLDECIGENYSFVPDLKTEPPKSRSAKGWVKSIVLS